ncbi:MAG: SDR family oxidoreductase, partial [Bacteroidetes bacterium]|nr:SDR family oxidoreductase [Bacteroidota bacterium]
MNILITGASRGLGKAIAEKFAAAGHSLLLTARNEVALYQSMEDLLLRFPQAAIKAKAFDVSSKPAAQELGRWAAAQGAVDILINNAGSFTPGSVNNEPDNALEEMIQTNL